MSEQADNTPAREAGEGVERDVQHAPATPAVRRSSLLKWTVGTVLGFVALIGLLIGAFQLVVTQVPEYRVELQDWIGERTGLVVEFGSLSARLRPYGPELVFDDAVVRTPDRTYVLATARRGALAFDVWTSIASGRLTAGRFSLDAPQIGLIRTREGRIQLAGQSALEQRPRPFAIEHLPVGQYRVRGAHVTFRDEATGRGPWALSGVSFELDRGVDLLELEGGASLPRSLGATLAFEARAVGPLEAFATLDSSFSLTGTELDLAGWADLFPDDWPVPETGHGTLRVNGRFAGPTLSAVVLAVDFRDIAAVPPMWTEPLPAAWPLVHPPGEDELSAESSAALPETEEEPPAQERRHDLGLLSYERIAFKLRAQRVEHGWRMAIDDLDLSRRDSPWQAAHLESEWTSTPEGGLQVSAKADRIVLGNFWPLLAYLPERPDFARLRAIQGSGSIADLVLHAERDGRESPLEYSLQARLDELSFAPVGKSPGLSGISGVLRATEEQGALQLDAERFVFELPRLFREPLHAGTVNGALEWKRGDAGWHIESDQVLVRNADGEATARFALALPADGSSPVLDLSAQGRVADVSATRRYLPAGRLRAKSLEWLDQAFVSGEVPQAEIVYRGPMRSFPFRGDEGLFLARGRVEGVTFNYQPGWMPAEHLTGEFEFRNEGLRVRSGQGSVGGLRLENGSASIEDFRELTVDIHGEGRGDLQHALQYVRTSPLGPVLGEQFARLRGNGEVQARVDLHLPLKNMPERAVEVHARLDDATVRMRDLDAPVSGLAGTLTVRDTGLAAAELAGEWLGGPVAVQVETQSDARGRLVAHGTSLAADLVPLLDLPAAVALAGSADWQLEVPLAGKERPRQLILESDLRGLAIDLPEPLGKSAAEARALRIELESEDARKLLTRVAFGDLRGLMQLRDAGEGWRLDRGSIRPDGVAASLPDHSGLRLEGTLERLELDGWLALREPGGTGGSAGRLSDYLRAANLRIGKLELFGYEWSDVRGLLHATPRGWRVNVAGPMAEGELVIPYDLTGEAPLAGKFERLTLARGMAPDGETAPAAKVRDPRVLPAIEASISELQIGPSRLGTLELKAARVPEGLRVDTLTVAGAAFHGTARGHWLRTAEGDRSRLDARLVSSDVGATLRALGYNGFMEAKHGEILADLTWPGGFDAELLGRASGTLAVAAENGQLLNLQPGAGRLLGLFSVAALPRRLALDFSDLTDKGLSFDSVHGDFELRNGDAYTRNLLLRGPAAEIGIAGRTGLGTQDYDQTAVVTGNLGASLPVAGALAGGPAVGAALLLFSQMFKEPLKGITRGYYRITGTWENPVVERVDAAEIKEASARDPAVRRE